MHAQQIPPGKKSPPVKPPGPKEPPVEPPDPGEPPVKPPGPGQPPVYPPDPDKPPVEPPDDPPPMRSGQHHQAVAVSSGRVSRTSAPARSQVSLSAQCTTTT